MKTLALAVTAALASLALGLPSGAAAQERTVKIAGFGAKSGVVRSFGVNSEAAMLAAADEINKAGGVKLGDGTRGKVVVEFFDDRCNAEEGISVLRRIASADCVVAVGPTCSNVAEPLFGILQKKVGDASDSGLQMPVFTDVAIKGGLAKISEWAFRNVPNEVTMYSSLFNYLRTEFPDVKSVYGGVEEDFAHSRASWYVVMKDRANANGFKVLGESKWLLNDTNFATQVREMKKANPDAIAISAHPFTTCGVLKEMQRQGVKPKLLIGLTRALQPGDARGLREAGRGHDHPDELRAGERRRRSAAAKTTAKFKGSRRSAQHGGVGEHVHPQGRHGEREGARQARHRPGRPPQGPRRAREAEDDRRPARHDEAHRGPRGGEALRLRAREERAVDRLPQPTVETAPQTRSPAPLLDAFASRKGASIE